MKPRQPAINHYGLCSEHDVICPVLHNQGVNAVHNINLNVFEPSWQAQSKGWRLVKCSGRFRAWLITMLCDY